MLVNKPGIRLGLYLLGLAGLSAAPIIGVWAPDVADAIRDAANVLGAAALGTAALNTPVEAPAAGRHAAN